eukprot:232556-Hanusia_phi.AAC.1
MPILIIIIIVVVSMFSLDHSGHRRMANASSPGKDHKTSDAANSLLSHLRVHAPPVSQVNVIRLTMLSAEGRAVALLGAEGRLSGTSCMAMSATTDRSGNLACVQAAHSLPLAEFAGVERLEHMHAERLSGG